ncbi:MAG: hypothetical protein RIU67_1252, partial [Actinomycetota bacterium]
MFDSPGAFQYPLVVLVSGSGGIFVPYKAQKCHQNDHQECRAHVGDA